MIDAPRIAEAPARQIAYIPLTVPADQMGEVVGPGLQEIFAALRDQGVAPAGPWLAYHRRRPTDEFDFEIAVPVDGPVRPVGRVEARELAATRVARTVYQGGYEGLGDAWGELMAWVEAEGLPTSEAFWEVYLAGPEAGSDEAGWRTELNRPLIG